MICFEQQERKRYLRTNEERYHFQSTSDSPIRICRMENIPSTPSNDTESETKRSALKNDPTVDIPQITRLPWLPIAICPYENPSFAFCLFYIQCPNFFLTAVPVTVASRSGGRNTAFRPQDRTITLVDDLDRMGCIGQDLHIATVDMENEVYINCPCEVYINCLTQVYILGHMQYIFSKLPVERCLRRLLHASLIRVRRNALLTISSGVIFRIISGMRPQRNKHMQEPSDESDEFSMLSSIHMSVKSSPYTISRLREIASLHYNTLFFLSNSKSGVYS